LTVLQQFIQDLREDRDSSDKLIQLLEDLRIIPQILNEVQNLRKEVQQLQMDLSKFQAAFSTFATDFGTFATDFGAFLKTVAPTDPAQQAAIDNATSQLTAFDQTVKDLDAAIKPAAGTGGTPTGGV
jgi:conjugal transfer/entry exclusion protein